MTYENQTYGTKLTYIVVNGRFTGNRLEIEQLPAKAGVGTVQAKGSVSLHSAAGPSLTITATLHTARISRNENTTAHETGDLTPQNGASKTTIFAYSPALSERRPSNLTT